MSGSSSTIKARSAMADSGIWVHKQCALPADRPTSDPRLPSPILPRHGACCSSSGGSDPLSLCGVENRRIMSRR
jgi:hypothetical protein